MCYLLSANSVYSKMMVPSLFLCFFFFTKFISILKKCLKKSSLFLFSVCCVGWFIQLCTHLRWRFFFSVSDFIISHCSGGGNGLRLTLDSIWSNWPVVYLVFILFSTMKSLTVRTTSNTVYCRWLLTQV